MVVKTQASTLTSSLSQLSASFATATDAVPQPHYPPASTSGVGTDAEELAATRGQPLPLLLRRHRWIDTRAWFQCEKSYTSGLFPATERKSAAIVSDALCKCLCLLDCKRLSGTAVDGGGAIHHLIVSKIIVSPAASPALFSGPQHTSRPASSLHLQSRRAMFSKSHRSSGIVSASARPTSSFPVSSDKFSLCVFPRFKHPVNNQPVTAEMLSVVRHELVRCHHSSMAPRLVKSVMR